MKKTSSLSFVLTLLGALLFLLALGSVFLPFVKTITAAGEEISFFGWQVLFGGTRDVTMDSGTYSFSFTANIPLLVICQALLLSLAACLLGRRGYANRIFAIVFGLGAFVALLFSKKFVTMNSSLVEQGLSYGIGCFLSAFFTGAGVVSVLASIYLKREKHNNNN